MYKMLVVALFGACMVNVACLCGHLAPLVTTGLDPVVHAGSSAASITGSSPAMTKYGRRLAATHQANG